MENGKRKIGNALPLVIGIKREDVEAGDISGALWLLNSMMNSPKGAREFKEGLDICFVGYDDEKRPLWEIEEVRKFVRKLDKEFPAWLFFLSKFGSGIQCIMLCLLPRFKPVKGVSEKMRPKVYEILTKSWLPAMEAVCDYVDATEDEIKRLSERAASYIVHGPFRLGRER